VKAEETIGSSSDAVVGAGLAGLTAARKLEATSAPVLEAADRVGGRAAREVLSDLAPGSRPEQVSGADDLSEKARLYATGTGG